MPSQPNKQTMCTSYTKTNLYGGAIAVSLPADFADVSSIRDVPDHQEVYLSRRGLSSIIFDIVERAEPPEHPSCTTDADALKYHFDDVVDVSYRRQGSNEIPEETKYWGSAQAVFAELSDKPAYTMFATQHPLASQSTGGSTPAPDFTALLLVLLRLEEQKTDILITFNVPHIAGEPGYEPQDIDLSAEKNGILIDEAMNARAEVLKTFHIVDWDLFAGGDEQLGET